MSFFTDQMDRQVEVASLPQRIISLVPSLTELLVDLGLGDRVVGVTKFCIHPKGFKEKKTIIGGTKQFRFDVIESLRPDLIIGNKEENYKEGIVALEKNFPVWMSDVFDLDDALDMILRIGMLTGKEHEAAELGEKIRRGFEISLPPKGTAVYLIWQDPIITVGKHTFIDKMIHKAGFKNLVEARRYPQISLEDIAGLNPEFILLSSEPFPFKEKHLKRYQEQFPNAVVRLVDGELFSWYGSRLIHTPDYLKRL
ncbi:helical backbone metal receptor [Echinicola sediminis]